MRLPIRSQPFGASPALLFRPPRCQLIPRTHPTKIAPASAASFSISSSRHFQSSIVSRDSSSSSSPSPSSSTATASPGLYIPPPGTVPLQLRHLQQQSPQSLPYFVSRTASNNLPVYHDRKSGKTQKLTLVRKVAGDPSALMRELRDALSFPDENIKVNPVTRHVVIKGHHMPAVKQWLVEKGF